MPNHFKRSRKEFIESLTGNTETVIEKFFHETVGESIPLPPIHLSVKNNIVLRSCTVHDQPLKLIYTVGLSALQNTEVIFCLPKQWEIRKFLSASIFIEETFPIDIIRGLIKKAEKKGSMFKLEEGLFIDRNKSPWDKLQWDERVTGLMLLNLSNGDEPKNSDTIDFLVMLPILQSDTIPKKQALSHWIKTQRSRTWHEISLPYNKQIDPQLLLNESVFKHSLDGVVKAIADGANVNYPYFWKHHQFGYTTEDTILEQALYAPENEKIIFLLIEHGAHVPKDAMASLINWGNREIYDLLLKHGADINAESVNMTALDRAISFKNTECIKLLKELGAKER